jgi:hypothetical protein
MIFNVIRWNTWEAVENDGSISLKKMHINEKNLHLVLELRGFLSILSLGPQVNSLHEEFLPCT